MDLLVVSFANNKNILSSNLEISLKKYNYNHIIIGEGLKWVNFMTKIQGCYEYIKNNVPDNYIVIICDAYDVYACDDAEVLLNKFLKFDKKIVFGCENKCGTNCIPLDFYYRYNQIKRKRYQYVNGGFYMGYKAYILKMLGYILSLDIDDDQIAICRFINEYPEIVGLDDMGTLVSNIQLYSYFDTIWENNRVYNKETNEYPCFIHMPAISFDVGRRLDYFGPKVVGEEYKSLSIGEKCTIVYKKLKSRPWIFFLIFLIILFFVVIIKQVYI